MTLFQIIESLKKIALTQPNIRTAMDGDVFDAMNANPSVKYGVFHVTQTTHTEDEQFDNYGFNLFVIDRLEVDDTNRVSAQSTAKQILSNIIATFCETFDAEHEVITYQPFTQRFKDNTCGVWASVTMQVVKDYSCAEIFGDGAWRPEIVVINNQDITITSNGVYEPSEGYTGFGKVEVALDIPNVKESDTLYLMAGDNGVYKPESPYNAVGEVIYHVEPNQNKTIDVVENGEYVVMPDEGFGGLGAVEVNVSLDIPVVEDKVRLLIKPGESGTLYPGEGYDAMKEVEYSAPSRMTIPNGINFEGSTIEEFPVDDYDWSILHDGTNLFKNCTNLKNTEQILNTLKDNLWVTEGAFYGTPIEVIDGIDFNRHAASYQMFSQLPKLQEVRNCVAAPKEKLTSLSSTSNYGAISVNHNFVQYKVVDCDWSNVTESYNPFGDGYYFANIKTYIPLGAMPVDGDRLYVVEFEASAPYTSNDRVIWYKPGLTSWQGPYCFPWGFSFIDKTGGIESVELVPKLTGDKVTGSQVIPYVGDGRFEADYPIYRGYDVKVNGVIAPSLSKSISTVPYQTANLYLPISNPSGVYEGKDIEKLIYYATAPPLPVRRVDVTDQGVELWYTTSKSYEYGSVYFYFMGNNSRISITFQNIGIVNYDTKVGFGTSEGSVSNFVKDNSIITNTYDFGERAFMYLRTGGSIGEYGIRITKIEYL